MDLEGEEYMSIIDAFRLDGKVAVVTGANTGLGQGMSVALAQAGAKVVGVARRSCEDTKKLIEADGGEFAEVIADLSDMSAIDVIVNGALAAFGKVDILVNNAGITKDNLIGRMKDEDFDAVIDVNLKGTFYMMRGVSRLMLRQRAGRIINMSSVVGVMGNAGQVNYSASKAGVIGMTKSLARELASRHITVNAVAPGMIETDMTGAMSDAVKEKVVENIPFKEMGKPEDIAETVAFLAGDGARYITGQVLCVDGGMAI